MWLILPMLEENKDGEGCRVILLNPRVDSEGVAELGIVASLAVWEVKNRADQLGGARAQADAFEARLGGVVRNPIVRLVETTRASALCRFPLLS